MTCLWSVCQSLRQWNRGVKSDYTVLLRAWGGAAAYTEQVKSVKSL